MAWTLKDQIQVVVQPQSIIHSAVEYVDGAVIAQLGTPDMQSAHTVCPVLPGTSVASQPGDRLDLLEVAGAIDL